MEKMGVVFWSGMWGVVRGLRGGGEFVWKWRRMGILRLGGLKCVG